MGKHPEVMVCSKRSAFFPLLTLLAVLMIPALTSRAQSDVTGAVLSRSGNTVRINRGSASGVQSGDVMVVQRGGRKLGLIRVTKLSRNVARAEVISREPGVSFVAGDIVSYQILNPTGQRRTPAPAPKPRSRVTYNPYPYDAAPQAAPGAAPQLEYLPPSELLPSVPGTGAMPQSPSAAYYYPPSSPALDFDQAIARERAILETNPSNRGAMVRLADDYFQAGMYEQSVTWYKAAVEADRRAPDTDKMLFQIARAYGSLRQAGNQRLYLDFIRRHYPGSPFAGATPETAVGSAPAARPSQDLSLPDINLPDITTPLTDTSTYRERMQLPTDIMPPITNAPPAIAPSTNTAPYYLPNYGPPPGSVYPAPSGASPLMRRGPKSLDNAGPAGSKLPQDSDAMIAAALDKARNTKDKPLAPTALMAARVNANADGNLKQENSVAPMDVVFREGPDGSPRLRQNIQPTSVVYDPDQVVPILTRPAVGPAEGSVPTYDEGPQPVQPYYGEPAPLTPRRVGETPYQGGKVVRITKPQETPSEHTPPTAPPRTAPSEVREIPKSGPPPSNRYKAPPPAATVVETGSENNELQNLKDQQTELEKKQRELSKELTETKNELNRLKTSEETPSKEKAPKTSPVRISGKLTYNLEILNDNRSGRAFPLPISSEMNKTSLSFLGYDTYLNLDADIKKDGLFHAKALFGALFGNTELVWFEQAYGGVKLMNGTRLLFGRVEMPFGLNTRLVDISYPDLTFAYDTYHNNGVGLRVENQPNEKSRFAVTFTGGQSYVEMTEPRTGMPIDEFPKLSNGIQQNVDFSGRYAFKMDNGTTIGLSYTQRHLYFDVAGRPDLLYTGGAVDFTHETASHNVLTAEWDSGRTRQSSLSVGRPRRLRFELAIPGSIATVHAGYSYYKELQGLHLRQYLAGLSRKYNDHIEYRVDWKAIKLNTQTRRDDNVEGTVSFVF